MLQRSDPAGRLVAARSVEDLARQTQYAVEGRSDAWARLALTSGSTYAARPMSVVQDYWDGVLQRLRAEVNVFARLIQHRGEQGRENEAAFARLLTSFAPQRLGVGTGLLIDSDGGSSRQQDIVLFERSDEPAVLAQTNQLLYPVESVIACIEVKTRLTTSAIEDCGVKTASIRALNPKRRHADGAGHPLILVLAYSTEVGHDTTLKRFREMDGESRPDLVCVLDPSLLIGPPANFKLHHDQPYHAGLTLLQERTDDGSLTDAWVTSEVTRNMLKMHGTQQYRVVAHEGENYLADSGRALLLFVESLARLAAVRQGRDEPVVSSYLDDDARALAWL